MQKTRTLIILITIILLIQACNGLSDYRTSRLGKTFQEYELQELKDRVFELEMSVDSLNSAVKKLATRECDANKHIVECLKAIENEVTLLTLESNLLTSESSSPESESKLRILKSSSLAFEEGISKMWEYTRSPLLWLDL